MKHILAILVVALLFSHSSAFAETKEIISEGTYNMGDGEQDAAPGEGLTINQLNHNKQEVWT